MNAPSQAETPAQTESSGGVRVTYRRYAGMRTRVLENGTATAVAMTTRHRRRVASGRLVLLHGFCDSADTWADVLEGLAEQGYPAVAVDLPGFGFADALRSGAILPQLDAFVSALLAEQSVFGPVLLAGNSLGGTLSVRAAQASSTIPAGVASIAAPGLADSWKLRYFKRYPLPLRLYANLPLAPPAVAVRAVARQLIPRLIYAERDNARQAHVRRFTDTFPDYSTTIARLDQARRLAEELDDAYQPDRVRLPMLVVACGKDRLVRAAAGRKLHTLVPHSRLLVREDWGHCPQLDDPPAMAGLLGYFAASVTHADERQPGRVAGTKGRSA